MAATTALAGSPPDPFAANNTVYPDPAKWRHGMRPSHFNYPTALPVGAAPQWLKVRPKGALTLQTAPAYVEAVKRFIEPGIRGVVEEPLKWTPQAAGWYDMPWGGQGSTMSNGQIDPTSGREALLGSYTGQILQPMSYPSNPPSKAFQNHAVVYYNDVAAYQLGQIWKDPFRPDLKAAEFPEGSIVVKVEAATLTPEQWPVLRGSTVSHIFRPPVEQVMAKMDPTQRTPVVTEMRFLQMAVRIKDKIASPQTGWVFIAFAYNADAPGARVWDRTVPVGAMWGNDPKLARLPNGVGPGKDQQLQETWVSPTIPAFVRDGLGWGGRLAGPLDLGIRHNVVTVSGVRYDSKDPKDPKFLRSSSCVSCHSAGQYPFVANLYPSPNMHFPPEGGQFLMYDPGSADWARWFQNLKGRQALSGHGRSGIVGTDYDMLLTFALMTATGAAGTDAFIRNPLAGH